MPGLFTEADVVSTYTDAEAVGDGTLVDVDSVVNFTWRKRRVQRVTRSLFGALERRWQETDPPISTFPVFLRQWLVAQLAAAKDSARPGEERNYIWVLPSKIGAGDLIWLARNESGGWTLMFASDW